METVVTIALLVVLVIAVLMIAIAVIRNCSISSETRSLSGLAVGLIVAIPFIVTAIAYGVLLSNFLD